MENRVLSRDALFAASPRTLPRVHLVPRFTPNPFHDRLSRFESGGSELLAQRTEFGGEGGNLVERDERLEAQETLAGEGERGRKRGELGTDFGGLLREPSQLWRWQRRPLRDRRLAQIKDLSKRTSKGRDVRAERFELFSGSHKRRSAFENALHEGFDASVLTSRSRSPTLTSLISLSPSTASALGDVCPGVFWLSGGAPSPAVPDGGSCATCSGKGGVLDATTSEPDMVSQVVRRRVGR